MLTEILVSSLNTCSGCSADYPITIIARRSADAPSAKPLYSWRATEDGWAESRRIAIEVPDDAVVLQLVTGDRFRTHLESQSECPISIASRDGDDVALSIPVGWSAYVVSTATLAERAVRIPSR